MGSCFDRKTSSASDSTSSLVERKSLDRTGKTYGKSGLLYRNISKEIISEEDSQLLARGSLNSFSIIDCSSRNGSVVSIQKQQTQPIDGHKKFLVLISEFQKDHPLGLPVKSCVSVRIRNFTTGRWLHSHAIKSMENKTYEVCTCKEGQHVYDWWVIISDHKDELQDQNVVLFNHKLIKGNMRAKLGRQLTGNLQQQLIVNCGGSLNDLAEEDYWKVILFDNQNGQLQYLDILSQQQGIRHIQTDGSLHSGQRHSILQDQYVVSISFRNDQKDLWYIDEVEENQY